MISPSVTTLAIYEIYVIITKGNIFLYSDVYKT